MTRVEVQEAIDLTPKQQKAWESFERALKKCRDSNIYFYQVLDYLAPLNGNNVATIAGELDGVDVSDDTHPCNLQYLHYDRTALADSWTDDTHFVVLKDGDDE